MLANSRLSKLDDDTRWTAEMPGKNRLIDVAEVPGDIRLVDVAEVPGITRLVEVDGGAIVQSYHERTRC